MRKTANELRYSPTDLCRFMESPYASWMDRYSTEHPGEFDPDVAAEEMLILTALGAEHEAVCLERLRAEGRRIVDVPRDGDPAAATLRAMRDGAEVIYQGALTHDGFFGYPDFLVRTARPSSLGDYSYEVWDAKLARKAKPDYMIQLCCYAEMLKAVQGLRPAAAAVVLGTGDLQRFRTDDYFYYYASLKRSFLEFMRRFDPERPPEPGPPGTNGRWDSHAEAFLTRTDHLLQVASIRRNQIAKLRAAGIDTMTALARSELRRVTGIGESTYGRLHAQAQLQIASAGRSRPEYEIVPADPEAPRRGLALLPPRSKQDVFFDIEGYPFVEGGLEYLLGAVHVERGRTTFVDWWAHDAAEERAAFEAFIDWAYARWRADPKMHIYHYAAYEVSAMRRLMGRYGSREEEVDNLLRYEVFVDLYTVVRQGLVVGTPSYSIKDIEKLYRDAREGGVVSAAGSIVAYQHWLESDEGPEWRDSPILEEIRNYNRDDCESLVLLADWLRERQKESGVAYVSPANTRDPEAPVLSEKAQAQRDLATALLNVEAGGAEERRIADLLGYLVEFHRREDKPAWWAMFDRQSQEEELLAEDLDCLAGLQRTEDPPETVKQSTVFGYRFDPDQDTKVDEEDSCLMAHNLFGPVIVDSMNREDGLVTLKVSKKKLSGIVGGMPNRLSLIPGRPISTAVIEQSIEELAGNWLAERDAPRALLDFLRRNPPRISGHDGGPLQRDGEDTVSAAIRIAAAMDETTLCIQGPPGTGKTYTAARVIVQLMKLGKRVGITSNSHKAILNLMSACAEAHGTPFNCIKVGGPVDDPFYARTPGAMHLSSKDAKDAIGDSLLFGGTAWFFSSEEVRDCFDYLFVDEAGQVAIARLAAMAPACRNIVLLGDQMQLGQPIQGSHPGESGTSTLDYLLQESATVPAEMGLFLGTTHRLHPRLCSFISGAVYEDRLHAADKCSRRVVHASTQAGIVFVPVEHEGNTQGSDEEVRAIADLHKDLLGRTHTGDDGEPAGQLTVDDILVIAPYNMQVRKLMRALPHGSRVGTVDKFQGQEAPVVILSMCASDATSSPRGMDFIFDPNRLNVAISRARSLAFVVGNPALANTSCGSIRQMKLANLYCRILASSDGGTWNA